MCYISEVHKNNQRLMFTSLKTFTLKVWSSLIVMFGIIIVDSSVDVLFEHRCENLIRKQQNFDSDSDQHQLSDYNNFLMQLLAPLFLSRKVLKSELSRDLSSLRFGNVRMAFADRSGFTFLSIGKFCSESELKLFLINTMKLTERLLGPDFAEIKVSYHFFQINTWKNSEQI
jgi:hypothetical protein